MRLFLSLLTVFLITSAPLAMAQTEDHPTMEEIEQAWQAGDFVLVRKGLEHLAEVEGTALAQYRYGRVLLEGRGGPQDPAAARDWLEKSVAQNNVAAATLLARLYLTGYGDSVARDADRAAALLSNAAARGEREAQYYLALLYKSGEGLTQDSQAAFNWFLAAAEQSHPQAQFEVSKAYSRGEGTPVNQTEAYRWLSEAALSGITEAQYFYAQALDQGTHLPKDPRAALEWYTRAAEAGLPIAQRILGGKYLTGAGTEANPSEALRWLTAAANAGDPGAMANLGHAYATGNGLPQDDVKALVWYDRAAGEDLGRATQVVARFHEVGRAGLTPDLRKAVELYRKAITQGAPQAGIRLGQLTLAGDLDDFVAPHSAVPWVLATLETDTEAAEAWLMARAAENIRPAQAGLGQWLLTLEGRADDGIALLTQAAKTGDVPAQAQLGKLYMTGSAVDLDYVQAHAWLNIAAASGHAEATETRALIDALMTPEQIAEAQDLARAHFEAERAAVPQTSQTVQTEEVGR